MKQWPQKGRWHYMVMTSTWKEQRESTGSKISFKHDSAFLIGAPRGKCCIHQATKVGQLWNLVRKGIYWPCICKPIQAKHTRDVPQRYKCWAVGVGSNLENCCAGILVLEALFWIKKCDQTIAALFLHPECLSGATMTLYLMVQLVSGQLCENTLGCCEL